MIATHAKRETKERKRQMTCVCAYQLCVLFFLIREKYVAQVIHRWPTGGCDVAAAAAAVAGKCHANAVHVCVQKWWAGGFIEPVGSIIIIQSLSHG
jgi:hypothetical protein